jgi:dTDP-4-dehydrorhamnose 3,5-epimerase
VKAVKQFLGGVTLFETPRFGDDRGSFAIPYQAQAASDAGLPERFVQDNHSTSAQPGTLRGMHLQLAPWSQGKLVRVLRGRILDAFVDLRPDAEHRGASDSVELSGDDDFVLWVPPGLAHGFCTLEPDTEVFYKVDAAYNPEAEISLAWDDPTVGIEWPVTAADVTLSAKDQVGLDLAATLARYDEALAAG